MRLDRFLCKTTNLSRSEAKKVIKQQKVMIQYGNQKSFLCDESFEVDENADQIYYQGVQLKYQKYIYIMLNKPSGYITSTLDDGLTVMDLLDTVNQKELFPVGRLDKDTVGLLLITNNGILAHRLLSPKRHVNKKYYVRYAGRNENIASLFASGVYINDKSRTYLTIPAVYEKEDEQSGYLTIKEGKFHQVKKMFSSIGLEVVFLKRVQFGSLVLDDTLKEGQWRYLTEKEITELIIQ